MSSDTAVAKPSRGHPFGDLYDILDAHFPDHRSAYNVLNIPKLAKDLGFAHETLYRAVRPNPSAGFPEGMLKVPVAHKILQYCEENHPEQMLTWDDLKEYIFPEYHRFS